MKNIYVILAFHAHELLWDLPEKLLSYLDDDNPMKDTILDENYMKKRKKEDRDIYTLSIRFAENLQAPICVEYTNELLHQIKDVLPQTFQKLKEAYAGGTLYPVYGHAHHTHVSLLNEEELTQEIQWNMQFLHNRMGVPYPRYNGLFGTEASYSSHKMRAVEKANINYIFFPHLSSDKVPYKFKGKGDYKYKPFFVKTEERNILAFPRNFPISQEIWRPITKMKREEVKSQGYKLGEYPVFYNEYLENTVEKYPIEMDEGVRIYKAFLTQELENAPDGGVLLYIQDLELMDFGDIALEIMEKAWKEILQETKEQIFIHFVTPDQYLDEVVKHNLDELPELEFKEINWAPEIRLILRADGHYPPLGVTGGRYDKEKTGLYTHPHIFWENGKYFCGIFDTLLKNFNISLHLPAHGERLSGTGYDLAGENFDTQAVFYLRIMKRACNWGWRPTEGRQKLPCLKGFLFCSTLLKKLNEFTDKLSLNRRLEAIDERNLVGIIKTLDIFLDSRLNYLQYGMHNYEEEKGADLSGAYAEIEKVLAWKGTAVRKAAELYEVNRDLPALRSNIKLILELTRDYCQAVFMATDHIQRLWGKVPDVEYMVDKMYEYLYEIYPPVFPAMVAKIDAMERGEIVEFFNDLKSDDPAENKIQQPVFQEPSLR